MQNGLVSIGLPAYNGEKYLKNSLDSLLSQTYKNFELIISDDASKDSTKSICGEYAKHDGRIRFIAQEKNLGQFLNFALVLKEAKGEYFMWAAQDDWWDQRFVEILKNALDRRPKYGVAMSSYARFFDDGQFFKEIRFDGANYADVTDLNHGALLDMMMKRAPIHKFSYGLFRTELMKKLISRPFPSGIAWERVYMCEVAASTRFYSHPEVLYRVTTYRKNLKTRHGKSDVAKPYYDRWHYTKYIFTIIWRLFTSPIVPFYRKITIVPVKSLSLLWFGKGRIINEFSPCFYKLFKI